jgi:hypothetical protein
MQIALGIPVGNVGLLGTLCADEQLAAAEGIVCTV